MLILLNTVLELTEIIVERTFVILKPDTIARGIVGEIISRFEKAGLKIVAMKMVAPDEAHFHAHYENISKMVSRWGEDVFKVNLQYMQVTPVIALVLEGAGAIKHVRKMIGTTSPHEAAPGTIRGDYAHISQAYVNEVGHSLPTILHASGNAEEASQEIDLWFTADELYDYSSGREATVHGILVKK